MFGAKLAKIDSRKKITANGSPIVQSVSEAKPRSVANVAKNHDRKGMFLTRFAPSQTGITPPE